MRALLVRMIPVGERQQHHPSAAAPSGPLRRAAVLASIVLAVALTAFDLTPRDPHLPIFGPGKFMLLDSDAALTNASAHVAWSMAIPLAGKAVGGRKGLWVAGLTWMTWSVVNETFFHAPPKLSPAASPMPIPKIWSAMAYPNTPGSASR